MALHFLIYCLIALSLSACGRLQEELEPDSRRFSMDVRYYPESMPMMENARVEEGYGFAQNPAVEIPNSYYAGGYQRPKTHRETDRNWVREQHMQNYTIELAEDERAATVAKKLHLAPPNARRAEFSYQRAGRVYYKGLYGSYQNKEAAEKALDALPSSLQQGARVQPFATLQQKMD